MPETITLPGQPRRRGRPRKSVVTTSESTTASPKQSSSNQGTNFKPIIKTRAQRYVETGGKDGRPAPNVTPAFIKPSAKQQSDTSPASSAKRKPKKRKKTDDDTTADNSPLSASPKRKAQKTPSSIRKAPGTKTKEADVLAKKSKTSREREPRKKTGSQDAADMSLEGVAAAIKTEPGDSETSLCNNEESVNIAEIYESAAAVLSPKLLELFPGSCEVTLKDAAVKRGADLLVTPEQHLVQGTWSALGLLLQDLCQLATKTKQSNQTKPDSDTNTDDAIKTEQPNDQSTEDTSTGGSQPQTFIVDMSSPQLAEEHGDNNHSLPLPDFDDFSFSQDQGLEDGEFSTGAAAPGVDSQDGAEGGDPEQSETTLFPQDKKKKKKESNSKICQECGFQSSSVLGLQQHVSYYHSAHANSQECDICLATFRFRYIRERHRVSHFAKDGTLKESAIVVHRLHRKRLRRPENLQGALKACIEEYEQQHNLEPIQIDVSEIPEDIERESDSQDLQALEMEGTDSAKDAMVLTGDLVEKPKEADSKTDAEMLLRELEALVDTSEKLEEGALSSNCTIESEVGALSSETPGEEMRGQDAVVVQPAEYRGDSNDEAELGDKPVGETGEISAGEELPFELPVSAKDSDQIADEVNSQQKASHKPQHRCPVCKMCYITKFALKRHFAVMHASAKDTKKRKVVPTMRQQLNKQVTEADILECPHCDKVCYRIQNFTRHLKSHQKPNLFKCDQCEYTHQQRGEVMRHKRNAHNEKTFVCDDCGHRVRTQALLNAHIKYKHDRACVVVCEVCGKSLVNKNSYRNHKALFHGDPQQVPGSVTCQKCHRILKSQKAYKDHWRKFHGEDSAQRLEEPEVSEGVAATKGGAPYYCKYCNYRNDNARQVRLHIIRVHVEKNWKCPHCSRGFAREAHLQKHINVTHLKLDKVKCEQCGKTYATSTLLKYHIKRVHEQAKNYHCDICERDFYDRRNLKDHMEMHKPEDERSWKFQCDLCEKRFRFRNNLEYHMHSHTGTRDHVCGTCGQGFKTKWILDKHELVHTEKRPCVCGICGKSFKLQKYLSVHMLSHSTDKFLCRACGKLFPTETTLERHRCRAVVGDIAAGTGVELIGEVSQFTLADIANLPDTTHIVIEPAMENDLGEYTANLGDIKVEQLATEEMTTELITLQSDELHGVVTDQDPVRIQGVLDSAGDGETMVDADNQVVISFVAEDGNSTEETEIVNQSDDMQQAMYMCGICNKLFASTEDIQNHLAEHIKPGTHDPDQLAMEVTDLVMETGSEATNEESSVSLQILTETPAE